MQFSLFVYVCLSFLFCSLFGGHSCKEINGDISSQAISFNFFTFMLQFGGQCVHTLALSGCSSDRVNIWAMTDHIIWVLEGSSARDVSWQCLMQLAASTRVPFRWQALPIALGAHCRLLLSPVLSFSPDQQLLGHVRLSAVCLFTLHLDPSESTTMLQCAANINKVGLHDQDRLL